MDGRNRPQQQHGLGRSNNGRNQQNWRPENAEEAYDAPANVPAPPRRGQGQIFQRQQISQVENPEPNQYQNLKKYDNARANQSRSSRGDDQSSSRQMSAVENPKPIPYRNPRNYDNGNTRTNHWRNSRGDEPSRSRQIAGVETSQPNRYRNPRNYDNDNLERDNTRADRSRRSRGDEGNGARPMGFKTLEEIADTDSKDIILKITEHRNSFLKLLDTINIDDGKYDIFALILRLISKACHSSFDELKAKLLLEVCNSRFVGSLQIYLMDLPYAENRARNRFYWRYQHEFWDNFLTFCEGILDTSPATALQKCRSLIDNASKCCLDNLMANHGFTLYEEQNNKLTQLRERLVSCHKDKLELKAVRAVPKISEYEEPPNCFRELSVMPTRDDWLDSRPFLRENIVAGGYRDEEHYLDVQFRLLREDCFGPLRDGIHQYIVEPNKTKYDNIRVFRNVKFVEPYVSKQKIGVTVQWDAVTIKKLKRINWAHSKRFIFGSLLLFTKDNCKSFLTATILERDVKMLSQGRIAVSILDGVIENLYNEDSYTMIESEVYFEPYLHVLKALQDPRFPENIAMKKYIIHVDPEPKPPAYINLQTTFCMEVGNVFQRDFHVLNDYTWPDKDELGLNVSQYEAFKLAITHEFAVIQGPPGTGKTFLGVKVAKTLIENFDRPGCIMLVICYTNHALDQFLENILPVTNSIVRIGGQSRNEAMDNINLTKWRVQLREKIGKQTNRLFYETRNNLTRVFHQLQHEQKQIDSLNNGIISYSTLKKLVPESILLGAYYANHRPDIKSDPLTHWLFENMEYVNFGLILANEIQEENLEEPLNVENNSDDDRFDIVLDNLNEYDDNERNVFVQNEIIGTSFSVPEYESKLKTLLTLYKNIESARQKRELEPEIVDIKSRMLLFERMSDNRYKETRYKLHEGVNLGRINVDNRWAVYFKWLNIVINHLKIQTQPLQEELESANAAYEEARMMIDLTILKDIKVVGMTTSGAARLRKLLMALAAPIVIVEEAAEVLEQHIVTSLTKHCQHLILIGDHQQLRPSAAHMKLARHYNIEVSLFERMIKNGIHSQRLGVQHRMRPEIASLISPHIYPDLVNHPSVQGFPSVFGMLENVFFMSHNFKEQDGDDNASRSNHKEADIALGLANYLMQQGYEDGDVTILAAYSGQMFYMRKQRENYKHLSKTKITVVDNYQGEESKIIILSLVRNNDKGVIGFLGTENRVCVALSRAKEGFYILGNIDMLTNKSPLWSNIANTLKANSHLGPNLILRCENHRSELTPILSAKDFEKAPEGGCLLKCNFNLPCGHRCPLICHGYDRGHVKTKCFLRCERILCDLEHVCPLICYQTCEPCKRLVEKILPCGHKMLVECHKDPADKSIRCLTAVTVKLAACGHEAKKSCYLDTELIKCGVRCIYRVEKCGHECLRKCHVTDDPYHEKYNCEKPCANAKQGCSANLLGDRGEHQCQKKCFQECDYCTVKIKKKRSNCNHSTKVACNIDVDSIPCRNNCTRSLPCGHHCKKKCFEPCGDCKQKVKKNIPDCGHDVTVACNEEPVRRMCERKCERILPCGHPCKDKCSKPCDQTKCTELVPRKFSGPCGHDILLPCNIFDEALNNGTEPFVRESDLHLAGFFIALNSVTMQYVEKRTTIGLLNLFGCNILYNFGRNSLTGGGVSDALLLRHCATPCGAELSCGHACAGSCAACHQRRVHRPCDSICHQTIICGHQCQEPCSQVCPPCKMPCAIQCKHTRCQLQCGAPCVPCQENCTRACVHGRCRRRCGEPCDRPPCDEPCPRRLPCGHRCRGLCGELCPDICNVCRPDDFPKDFLNDDYDDDAKFIKLQDCVHVLDVENMDNLMTGDKETVTIRSCPFCRAPIINTHRYKDIVNNMFKSEINPIKEKLYGNAAEIKNKKELLLLDTSISRLSNEKSDIMKNNIHLKKSFDKLRDAVVKTTKKASLLHLDMLSRYLNILDLVTERYETFENKLLTELKEEFLDVIKIISSSLSAHSLKISEQLQKDIGNELKRLNSIMQLSQILSHPSYQTTTVTKIKDAASAAKSAVLTWGIFDENVAMIRLKELSATQKDFGTITKEERDLVVRAIGSKSGSWYKCPNGHFYCIDACGGAMQVSKCADCGAAVGGTNHALLSTNAHAGEIDGSSHAAWSNYHNIGNFDLGGL